ncbi:nuclear transport factor 2 family protein [Fodinicola acaciae]|uniref:nuclear transport factor 2 family protein n=1 Tax=Fodinicola acaciae TaxID=2681555 RepID=UPI0013D190AB|nr:nuclear transport factor 2 family protein [Fodinicola acaciae]
MSEANIDLALRYHEAVAAGAVGDELSAFFTADAVHHELPNSIIPAGARRDLEGILTAAEGGQQVVSEQSFDIENVFAADDQVLVESLWTGKLRNAMGDLPAGHVIRAHIATVLRIRDGRIAEQRNYDCYQPFSQPAER